VNVLVLGGGVFLGRHLVASLLARGHTVTTFTRGHHPIEPAPGRSDVIGDRDGGLGAVPRDGWDAVVDTCGFVPRVVRASVGHLRDAGRYAFISSISVYDEKQPELREDSVRKSLPDAVDPAKEVVDGDTYGPLKGLCEDAVSESFGERALVVRPGLIVGPNDPSDRFTYWPERGARGGTILAPSPPDRYVQFVDVRDLADVIANALEDGRSGDVNVTGTPRTTTMGDVVETARKFAGAPSDVCWVDDAFLVRSGVEPWTELPLWIPDSLGLTGFSNADVSRALGWGLSFRPILETMRDTLAWAQALPPDRTRKAGLTAEREARLIETARASLVQREPT
jgi:nucleoside-diphosphate-sugar epimerase